MNDEQYVLLVIQLTAVGQRSDVFDTLDQAQLETLVTLLAEAYNAAVAAAHARPVMRLNEQESP